MNFLYRLYFALPNFARIGIVGKAINRILGMILKRIFDAFVPAYLKRTAHKAGYGLNTEPRDEAYIVSLTSFPARINDIWITIEIILRQSFKPDKIILWLAKDQFPNKKLPESILTLVNRGLSIEFCNEDLRSHKKYFYVMQQYPDANIITLDDDLYYDKYVLENVVKLHKAYPKLIATNRAHKFTFGNSNQLKPYRKWQHNVTDKKPSFLLVPTGGAGTLYPPESLSKNTLDKNVFSQICFHADDLWLKVMSLLSNTNVITNNRYNKDFVTIKTTQKEKLVSNNVFAGGNDEQLKSVLEYYQIDLFQLLNNV